MTYYALILDSNGNGIGAHSYVEEPATYPSNEAACTEAQANQPMLWQLVSGALVQSLSATQDAQVALLRTGYAGANAAVISFTNAAGVTDTYQCDPASIGNLQNCLSGFRASASVPTGFYWRSAANQNNPFTYADLVNLAAAITARGFANFSQMQTLTAEVKAATTVAGVQAVVWTNP